jgi:urea carboxylase-associated protein 2
MRSNFPDECLRGGQAWSRVIRRGQTLRLTASADGASVALFAFRADALGERYNMPDTLKAQYTAFLTSSRVLMSDMGHVLMSITADTCGWHDTLTGHGDAADGQRFGVGTYQTLRNERHRNTRDNVLIEFAKHDLDARDLHANVNLFTKVVVESDGSLRYVADHAKAGHTITLRAELDVLVVLSNTPHPLDPTTTYAPVAVDLAIGAAAPPGPEDPCRCSRPENTRAFAMTEALFTTAAEVRP